MCTFFVCTFVILFFVCLLILPGCLNSAKIQHGVFFLGGGGGGGGGNFCSGFFGGFTLSLRDLGGINNVNDPTHTSPLP